MRDEGSKVSRDVAEVKIIVSLPEDMNAPQGTRSGAASAAPSAPPATGTGSASTRRDRAVRRERVRGLRVDSEGAPVLVAEVGEPASRTDDGGHARVRVAERDAECYEPLDDVGRKEGLVRRGLEHPGLVDLHARDGELADAD